MDEEFEFTQEYLQEPYYEEPQKRRMAIITLDSDDRYYLSRKYGFTKPDFINVAKKMRAGFSMMKAAKIIYETE